MTFTTIYRHYGVTADRSNPCIALVMDNTFEEGKTLIFDHLSRRENGTGLRMYEPEMLAPHEQYIYDLRDNMRACVEVVYGGTFGIG